MKRRIALIGALCAACASAPIAEPVPAPIPQQAVSVEQQTQAVQSFDSLIEPIEKLAQNQLADTSLLKQQLEAVLKIDPNHAVARFNRAVLYEKDSDSKNALALYEQLFAHKELGIPARLNAGRVHVNLGAWPKARKVYEDVLNKDRGNLLALSALALTQTELAEPEAAVKTWRLFLAHKPDSLSGYAALASNLLKLGRLAQAELVLSRGLLMAPNDVGVSLVMTDLLSMRKETSATVGQLKANLEKNPESVSLRTRLAQILLEYEDYAAAKEQLTFLLQKNPGDQNAKSGLAICLSRTKDPQGAEKLYQEVLLAEPASAQARWNLALLYERFLNRHQEAVALYQALEKETATKSWNIVFKDVLNRAQKAEKSFREAQERESKEKARLLAVNQACEALEHNQKPDFNTVGNEDERLESAWQLLAEAQSKAQAGELEPALKRAQCGFGMVPGSDKGKVEGCAPMRVLWAQVLYQAGKPQDALTTIRDGLSCDPSNADAQMIEQELLQMLNQAAAAGG